MIYSIPYSLLVIFLGILAMLLHQRRDDQDFCYKLKIVGVSVYFVFFAFRGFIFTDWLTYYIEFDNVNLDLLLHYELGKSREPLFLILMLITKGIINDFHFLIFICTAINTWLLITFFRKYTDNIFICLVLYLVFEGFGISINLMRNSIAIFIFLNAIEHLEKRQPLQYFGMCLMAVGFHFSAFVYIPLYFFFHRKMNKWGYLTILIMCNAVFIFHIPIFMRLISLLGIGGAFLENKIDVYSEIGNRLGFGMGFIERFITGLLVFLYYDKLNSIRPTNKIFINGLITYFICSFMFSEFTEISKRLAMLFVFSYWIIWGDLIKCFAIKNNRRLFIAYLCVYCLLKTTVTINQPVDQYENLLFGKTKSFQERKYIYDRTFEEPKY